MTNEPAPVQTSDTPTERPALTLSEAAAACGTHRNTIRRRLDHDQFPNAFREHGDGVWRVPVGDLLAAGLTLHRPSPPDQEYGGTFDPVGSSVPELDRLRSENSELRRRAEVAEAQAHERERALDIAERALRALEPGEGTGVLSPKPSSTAVLDDPAGQSRRRWPWSRKAAQ